MKLFFKLVKKLALSLLLTFFLVFEVFKVFYLILVDVFDILVLALIGQFLCKSAHILVTVHECVL